MDLMRAATSQPPASRIQNTTAPVSQTITTQPRNALGSLADTAARADAGTALVVMEGGEGSGRRAGSMRYAARGPAADGCIIAQVASGAAIMAASAAQAIKYRA
jgi:hypothetical protein